MIVVIVLFLVLAVHLIVSLDRAYKSEFIKFLQKCVSTKHTNVTSLNPTAFLNYHTHCTNANGKRKSWIVNLIPLAKFKTALNTVTVAIDSSR